MITKAAAIYGIGDALNQRAFLVSYCKQKDIPRKSIAIYTEKYWWMFEGLGFKRMTLKPDKKKMVPYRNFGLYDLPKTYECEELDKCIAKNAGIVYDFETCVPLPEYKCSSLPLPKRFITFNTGYGEFSGGPSTIKDAFCLKSWPNEYWTEFVRKIGVPCVQIGAGPSCTVIENGSINMVDKLSIKQSAEVLRRAMFHVDMEGGLAILNQHLGKRSVCLFGATAIQNQGRSFNLNLSSNSCFPCYEWGGRNGRLFASRSKLICGHRCMVELTPDYVIEQIHKSGWLEICPKIEEDFMVYP